MNEIKTLCRRCGKDAYPDGGELFIRWVPMRQECASLENATVDKAYLCNECYQERVELMLVEQPTVSTGKAE